jgi:hypothetical protein
MAARAPETVILRQQHRYVAHPHMVVLADGTLLLVANRGPRHRITLHPPQDPEFTNVLLRSSDGGHSWSAPVVAPAYGFTGTECAGLTVLRDGTVLLNQWRFRWHPLTSMPDRSTEPMLASPAELMKGLLSSTEIDVEDVRDLEPERFMPWARGGGTATVSRSLDGGGTFEPPAAIETAPYAGGYGMRGAVELKDGEILLPLADAPSYERVFLVRSGDGGRSFGPPEPIAATAGRAFEEPAPFLLPDGTILILLRENRTRSLFAVRSSDDGRNWTEPEATGITGYPAHVVLLPDGRLAAAVGRRRQPFGIEIVCSEDWGRSFDIERPIVVRESLPNKDLGYPTAVLTADGSLFVAYYYRDEAGVTGLYGRHVGVGN